MKTLSIKLYMSEVIYDIQNKTYLIGVNRSDGSNAELAAGVMINDDDENLNQIKRSLMDAYSSLLSAFDRYLVMSDKVVDNELKINNTVDICLSMPSNFNENVVKAIASSCHGFLVNNAIGEWFAITKPDEAESHMSKAVMNLQDISEAINRRVIPTRTKSREKWNIE